MKSCPLVTHRVVRLVAAALLAGAITACQAPGPRSIPAVPLELIAADAMHVAQACEPTSSVIVDFTVLENGQTDSIHPASGPACLQQALNAWVASFRYVPRATQTRTSVEWLLVEAKKGS